MTASFLDLPPRAGKPRVRGVTHVFDRGAGVAELAGLLASTGRWADLWKFGFGTAYVDSAVPEKLALLGAHDVAGCVGGTLLEVAWSQGKAEACLDWAQELGFPMVEVSNGATAMSGEEKRRLIRAAAGRFTVAAEVGSKDPSQSMGPARWAHEARADREAGARWVVAEGRESGTVGLYEADGSPRPDVADALASAVGLDAVVFEAPRKDQQAWLVNRFGADVSLGNVAPADLLGVEALRLGLRADTVATRPRGAPLRVAT